MSGRHLRGNSQGATIETIGSRFSYLLPDGSTGAGIPPFLPEFTWPWQQAGADGQRPVVAHEHVLARLVDLSDALLSALRLFRG